MKRAQGLLTLVVVALLFLGGVMALNFMRDDVTTARSISGMDCTNASLSDGAKMTCLGIDIALPYFIITFLSVAGGLVFEKLTL